MKVYNTVDEYIEEGFKPNDRVVFAGYGIVDGLKFSSKKDTFKTVKVGDDRCLYVKSYRGKQLLYLRQNSYDQKIQVLTKKEFNNLTNS